jgi:hypothetical protein
MPGAIAFDEHAGASVAETGAGGKHNSDILETTTIAQLYPYLYWLLST